MDELPFNSRFTESMDLFDNIALRKEVVILKKLLENCRNQLKVMKTIVSTLDQDIRNADEGQEIIKGYMNNIYKRIEGIEKTTQTIIENDTTYNTIVKQIELSSPRGANRILLPSIDEIFSEK